MGVIDSILLNPFIIINIVLIYMVGYSYICILEFSDEPIILRLLSFSTLIKLVFLAVFIKYLILFGAMNILWTTVFFWVVILIYIIWFSWPKPGWRRNYLDDEVSPYLGISTTLVGLLIAIALGSSPFVPH